MKIIILIALTILATTAQKNICKICSQAQICPKQLYTDANVDYIYDSLIKQIKIGSPPVEISKTSDNAFTNYTFRWPLEVYIGVVDVASKNFKIISLDDHYQLDNIDAVSNVNTVNTVSNAYGSYGEHKKQIESQMSTFNKIDSQIRKRYNLGQNVKRIGLNYMDGIYHAQYSYDGSVFDVQVQVVENNGVQQLVFATSQDQQNVQQVQSQQNNLQESSQSGSQQTVYSSQSISQQASSQSVNQQASSQSANQQAYSSQQSTRQVQSQSINQVPSSSSISSQQTTRQVSSQSNNQQSSQSSTRQTQSQSTNQQTIANVVTSEPVTKQTVQNIQTVQTVQRIPDVSGTIKIPRMGGYNKIENPKNDENIAKIFNFLSTKLGNIVNQLSLITVQRQVVSGFNYRFILGVDSSSSAQYTITVYQNLQGQFQLKSLNLINVNKQPTFTTVLQATESKKISYFNAILQSLFKGKQITNNDVLQSFSLCFPYIRMKFTNKAYQLNIVVYYDILNNDLKLVNSQQIQYPPARPVTSTPVSNTKTVTQTSVPQTTVSTQTSVPQNTTQSTRTTTSNTVSTQTSVPQTNTQSTSQTTRTISQTTSNVRTGDKPNGDKQNGDKPNGDRPRQRQQRQSQSQVAPSIGYANTRGSSSYNSCLQDGFRYQINLVSQQLKNRQLFRKFIKHYITQHVRKNQALFAIYTKVDNDDDFVFRIKKNNGQFADEFLTLNYIENTVNRLLNRLDQDQDIQNCLQQQNGVCIRCAYSYYLSQGKCAKVQTQCSDFNYKTLRCQGCYHSYYLDLSGVCRLANYLCRTSNRHGNCLTCFRDYRLTSSGKCVFNAQGCISNLIQQENNPLCSKFNRLQCLTCVQGCYMDKRGVCKVPDPNCFKFDQQSQVCRICMEGYSLSSSSRTCVPNRSYC